MQVEHKTSFWNFIKNNGMRQIKIPKIQRDYVQGRDDAKVKFSLGRLIDDIYDALFNDKELDLNYVYGKKGDNNDFIPIDGQQRLTTLLALHIYAFAKENMQDELGILKDKFIYDTRKTTRLFLENFITGMPDYFTEKPGASISAYVKDEAWFVSSWEYDPSVKSFLVVLDEIDKKFSGVCFADKLTAADCPVTFMELQIDKMGNENDLYIKMNSRGKLLTEFEVFKSNLFDYLDEMVSAKILKNDFSEEFKRLADTEWMDLIWDMRDGKEEDWDRHYIKLLHWLLLNRILPQTRGTYDDLCKALTDNGGFYNFDNYAKKINRDKSVIDAIYSSFEFLSWLQKSDKKLLNEIKEGVLLKVEEGEMRSRVILFAVTKYAMKMQGGWNTGKFRDWYRIIVNLVRNTEVDKEDKYCRACLAIDRLGDSCLPETLEYFAGTATDVSFIMGLDVIENQQKAEEILKAKLIVKNNGWYDPIIRAEQHTYFDRRIKFLFDLQNIDGNNLLTDAQTIKVFNENYDIAASLFDWIKSGNDNLFRRALLTFGDYSVEANSSMTFFFDGGNHYYDWRRMLREKKSFDVFGKFFEKFKREDRSDIGSVMQSYISHYGNKNEFLYNLITVPEMFAFMNENRYKYDEQNDRTVIYKKARLSAEYAEANTFALYCRLQGNDFGGYQFGRGYFDDATTAAYIKSLNGRQCKIEFKSGAFYVNGSVMKNPAGPVSKAEDAVTELKDAKYGFY